MPGAVFGPILTALALGVVLTLLARYVQRGRRQVSALRQTADPAVRRRFFERKIGRQALIMLVMPGLALLLTGNLLRALHPGAEIAALSATATQWLGLRAGDLTQALLSPWLLAELAVLIVAIEALPLLLRSRKVIVAGNFAVLRPRNGPELGWALLLAIVAGIGEELLFRGFLPYAFADLGVPLPAAFLLPVAIFGLCHLYQGPVGVIATTLAGLLLTALYLISGSLLVAMAVHVAIDVIGLVIRPAVGLALTRVLSSPA